MSNEREKIIKLKKQIGVISFKHKIQIVKEITDYAMNLGLTMDLDIIINLKVIGSDKVIT